MFKNKTRDLTKGSIIKNLLFLAIPIILSNILAMAYQLTDTFWVGRLGANSVAAISLSFPIIFLLTSIASGLAMGGSILVAQYKGKKDEKNVQLFSAQVFLLMFLSGLLISIIGYLFTPQLVSLMNPATEVFNGAVAYLRWSFIGITLLFIYYVYQALMHGVGEVRIPLYLVLFSVLLNLLLDPLFIFGWGIFPAMGVSGAALATIFTQGLAGVIALILMFKGFKGINLNIVNLKPNFKALKKIFKLAIPTSIEHSMMSLSVFALMFLVTSHGTAVVAAFGVGNRIFNLLFVPISGFIRASSTLVGQNFGANKKKQVKKIIVKVLRLTFVLALILSVAVFFSGEFLFTLFVPNENEVILLATQFLQLSTVTLVVLTAKFVLVSSFRAVGNTRLALIISLSSLWLLQLPIAYVLSNYTSLGYLGIWLAFPITDLLTFFITWFLYKYSKWDKIDLISDSNTC